MLVLVNCKTDRRLDLPSNDHCLGGCTIEGLEKEDVWSIIAKRAKIVGLFESYVDN